MTTFLEMLNGKVVNTERVDRRLLSGNLSSHDILAESIQEMYRQIKILTAERNYEGAIEIRKVLDRYLKHSFDYPKPKEVTNTDEQFRNLLQVIMVWDCEHCEEKMKKIIEKAF